MESVQKERNLIRNVREKLAYHLVDTTAILTPTNPLFVPVEVGLSGMSNQVSIDSRLTIASLSYAGLGWVYSRGRDLSRRIFHISDKTSERIQTFHDSAYTLIFNIAAMPPIYLSMGADLKQTTVGSISAAAMGVLTGPLMGYSIDIARDLAGLQECNRTSYPKKVKNQKDSVKKGIAALLVISSIAAMAGMYALNNKLESGVKNNHSIETIVSNQP